MTYYGEANFYDVIRGALDGPERGLSLIIDHDDYLYVNRAVRDLASKRGIPLRAPHYTVSTAGMVKTKSGKHPSEVYQADGGILYLTEVGDFSAQTLKATRKAIEDDELNVKIIAYDHEAEDHTLKHIENAARLLDLKTIDMRAAHWKPRADPSAVKRALEAIQRHRRRLGERPLDPVAAGWSDEDIFIEARRLGPLQNPKRLKRKLLRVIRRRRFFNG